MEWLANIFKEIRTEGWFRKTKLVQVNSTKIHIKGHCGCFRDNFIMAMVVNWCKGNLTSVPINNNHQRQLLIQEVYESQLKLINGTFHYSIRFQIMIKRSSNSKVCLVPAGCSFLKYYTSIESGLHFTNVGNLSDKKLWASNIWEKCNFGHRKETTVFARRSSQFF